MTIIEQKKLFNIIETWQDIKNMGFVISCNSQHINPDYKYFIKINKSILEHITMHDLSNIVYNHFMGCYGGTMDERINTDAIVYNIHAWND